MRAKRVMKDSLRDLRPDAEDAGEVDAAGGHVVAFLDVPGQALAGEGHGVEG